MIEQHLRPRIQPIFNYLGARLADYKITPNMVTRIAFFSGLCAAAAVAVGFRSFAFFLLICSGICDILDGTIARLTKTSHPFGAYMDLLADRMVEAAMIVGFAIAYPQHVLAYVFFLSSVLFHFSTFIVAGALFANNGNKSIHYDHSIVERSEAFIVFFSMIIAPQTIFPLLSAFGCVILASGYRRYQRVRQYAHKIR